MLIYYKSAQDFCCAPLCNGHYGQGNQHTYNNHKGHPIVDPLQIVHPEQEVCVTGGGGEGEGAMGETDGKNNGPGCI